MPTGINGADNIETDLDNATDGLGALLVEIDANETKIDTAITDIGANQTDLNAIIAHLVTSGDIHDVLYADAAGASIAVDIIENQTDLNTIITDVGTVNTVVDTNQDLLDGTTATPNAYRIEYGVSQVIEVSVTSAANAVADTLLATITDQPCVIDSIVIHADVAQPAHLTTCPVYGGVGKVVTLVGVGDATQANLDAADKQVGDDGVWRFAAAKAIVMEHNGTGADPLNLTVTITYHAAVDGGYLV